MNKAKTIFTTIFITICILASAQDTNGFYFKDFTPGQVILKNKRFARGKFNYGFALITTSVHYSICIIQIE